MGECCLAGGENRGATLGGDINADGDDNRGENPGKRPLMRRELCVQPRPGENAGSAACDHEGGQPPVDETGECVTSGRGEAESGDGEERGADRACERHAGAEHESRHDEEAAADAEKSG